MAPAGEALLRSRRPPAAVLGRHLAWAVGLAAGAAPLTAAGYAALQVLSGVSPAASLRVTQHLVNLAVTAAGAGPRAYTALLPWLGLLAASLALTGFGVFYRLQRPIAQRLTQHVEYALGEARLGKAARLPLIFFDRSESYDALERAGRAARTSATLFTDMAAALSNAVQAVSVALLFASAAPWLPAVLLAAGVAQAAGSLAARRRLHALLFDQTEERRRLGYVTDLLVGRAEQKEIRVFGLRGPLAAAWEAVRQPLRSRRRREQLQAQVGRLPADMAALCVLVGVVVLLAAGLERHTVTTGTFVALFGAVAQLQAGVDGLVSQLAQLQDKAVDVGYLRGFLELREGEGAGEGEGVGAGAEAGAGEREGTGPGAEAGSATGEGTGERAGAGEGAEAGAREREGTRAGPGTAEREGAGAWPGAGSGTGEGEGEGSEAEAWTGARAGMGARAGTGGGAGTGTREGTRAGERTGAASPPGSRPHPPSPPGSLPRLRRRVASALPAGGRPLARGVQGEGKSALLCAFPSPLRQGVRCEGLTFTYPGRERPALDGLDFAIRPGERVALVGENGSGKSTLVKCLLGLYAPERGRIRADGRDYRDIDALSLHAAVTAAYQDAFRFEFTAGESIGLGSVPHMGDPEAVAAAAREGGADTLVAGLPRGYDTPLGHVLDGGADLSGGQWQRIALARASMRRPQLLILDEPAAPLDPKVEAELYARFAALARERAVLLVSHRLGSARIADRIVVLRDGRCAEDGRHEELLRAGGPYAGLWEEQAQWYR